MVMAAVMRVSASFRLQVFQPRGRDAHQALVVLWARQSRSSVLSVRHGGSPARGSLVPCSMHEIARLQYTQSICMCRGRVILHRYRLLW